MHILSVGSAMIDIFLKPDIKNKDEKKIILTPGDKIPTDITATTIGGNAANAAVVLQKLGIDATLYTYLTNDFFSKEIEKGLKREKVTLVSEKTKGNTDFSLILTLDSDRVIFSHHDNKPHSFKYQGVPPDQIYLNSIGDKWEDAYKKVVSYVKKNNIPLVLSPGSNQIQDLSEPFYQALKSSKIFFSNRTEAQKIISKKFEETNNIKNLFQKMHSLGPEIVSITDGSKGSYASDGQKIYRLGIIKDKYTERTGAGDTYAASFLAWYTYTSDVGESMRAGALNASAVMKKTGAHKGILTHRQIQSELEKRKSFTPKNL